MGWLHGVEGGRVSATCRHGIEGFCRRCAFPTAEEIAADKSEAERAEAERVAAEAEKKAADEQAAEAKAEMEADFLASLSPYALAVHEERWQDAYKLLPEICWVHEFDPDGYPPPPKKVKRPSFAQFWETMKGGWRSYSDKP